MARKEFLERIKTVLQPRTVKKVSAEEESKQEAKMLVGNLQAYFVNMPLINPTVKKVKLPEAYISMFNQIINTSNSNILNNKYYPKVKHHLEEILKMDEEFGGISIDSIDYTSKGRDVQLLFYDFQDQKYWEDKSF